VVRALDGIGVYVDLIVAVICEHFRKQSPFRHGQFTLDVLPGTERPILDKEVRGHHLDNVGIYQPMHPIETTTDWKKSSSCLSMMPALDVSVANLS
jgi:hypothetical protein